MVTKPTEQTKQNTYTFFFFLVDFSSKRLISGVRQQNIKAKSVNSRRSKPNDICDWKQQALEKTQVPGNACSRAEGRYTWQQQGKNLAIFPKILPYQRAWKGGNHSKLWTFAITSPFRCKPNGIMPNIHWANLNTFSLNLIWPWDQDPINRVAGVGSVFTLFPAEMMLE